jgi:hypothetical protein
VKVTSGVDWRSELLLIERLNPIAEISILLDQLSQLGLNKVEEGVDLVLVVAPRAQRRPTERDVGNVSGHQRHRITSRTPHLASWTGVSA